MAGFGDGFCLPVALSRSYLVGRGATASERSKRNTWRCDSGTRSNTKPGMSGISWRSFQASLPRRTSTLRLRFRGPQAHGYLQVIATRLAPAGQCLGRQAHMNGRPAQTGLGEGFCLTPARDRGRGRKLTNPFNGRIRESLVGRARDRTSNIQHPTSNLQWAEAGSDWRFDVRCWMFDVRPWARPTKDSRMHPLLIAPRRYTCLSSLLGQAAAGETFCPQRGHTKSLSAGRGRGAPAGGFLSQDRHRGAGVDRPGADAARGAGQAGAGRAFGSATSPG